MLSPTWVPPRESEVELAAGPIRNVLKAVNAAIAAIESNESAATPWYLQTVEALGIDSAFNRELGPGMAMRTPTAADDPMPRLLVVRTLLSSYLERLECEKGAADVDGISTHRVVYESVVIALRRAGISAPAIAKVLRAKGYSADEATPARINSTIQKLQQRGVSLPKLPRGRPRT